MNLLSKSKLSDFIEFIKRYIELDEVFLGRIQYNYHLLQKCATSTRRYIPNYNNCFSFFARYDKWVKHVWHSKWIDRWKYKYDITLPLIDIDIVNVIKVGKDIL